MFAVTFMSNCILEAFRGKWEMNGEKMVCVSPLFSLKIETFHYQELKPIQAER
jgi:hypothetical protein